MPPVLRMESSAPSIPELDDRVEQFRREVQAALSVAASSNSVCSDPTGIDDMDRLEREMIRLESTNAALFTALANTQSQGISSALSCHGSLPDQTDQLRRQVEMLALEKGAQQRKLEQRTQALRQEVAALERKKVSTLYCFQPQLLYH
jgi:outer membrane murein-binding lipoprotein Lpp